MGKIVLLVSRDEMLYQAHNILQEKPYNISEMKVIRTEDAVSEARQAHAAGAAIIIARGLQASLIKQYTDIPVAEIVITAQEMALLVIRAKQILKKTNPVIGVVGFQNMFSDMSYFDTIYEIDLRTYFAKKGSDLEDAARQAVDDGIDLMIGGDTAVEVAGRSGIPSLFLSITEDSMRNSFEMAERMDYAMGAEKRNNAQMETLLDYSFHGVTRLGRDGVITDINPIMADILGAEKEQIQGRPVKEIYRELDEESLRQVLRDGTESYSLFMQINKTSIFAIVAPVLIDGKVDGAIMTCHRMKKRRTLEEETGRKRHSNGFIALGVFDDILQESKAMQECLHQAKLYALSDKPVLITGAAGTEKRLLAQSIHNASVRREKPFIDISCDGTGEERQLELIFGDKGAVSQAGGGTVLIEDIQCLGRMNQYRLLQLIRYHLRVGSAVTRYPGADVRVMATAGASLAALTAAGDFRKDLYYLLTGLTAEIPPLCKRREDLQQKIARSIRECSEQYSRYHVLTQGAMRILTEYPWPGNLFQVENFCERLILTANKRSLDEAAVRKVLNELYPEAAARALAGPENCGLPDHTDEPTLRDEERSRIVTALKQNRGNREQAALALGISKSTLWRKMKRYEIK